MGITSSPGWVRVPLVDEDGCARDYSMGLLQTSKTKPQQQCEHRVQAWWTSGRTGIARTDSAPNALHFTAPFEFGGLEGRWTPEDLLLSAIASCYTTTFRALADYSKFEYSDLEVEVAGRVQKVESGYAFCTLATRPTLTISTGDDEPRALRLLQKTQELCLVSRALATPHALEPRIQIGKTVAS